MASPDFMFMLCVRVWFGTVGKGRDGALVVGASALANKRRRPITLEVRDRHNGSVDGKLLIIDSEAMAMSVGIREEPALQNWVGTWLYSRHSVGWRERRLLDLCKEILRILIQYDPSDGAERVILMRPHFGQVEDIVTERLGLLRRHRLLWQVTELLD